jgi:hypothetical protein
MTQIFFALMQVVQIALDLLQREMSMENPWLYIHPYAAISIYIVCFLQRK